MRAMPVTQCHRGRDQFAVSIVEIRADLTQRRSIAGVSFGGRVRIINQTEHWGFAVESKQERLRRTLCSEFARWGKPQGRSGCRRGKLDAVSEEDQDSSARICPKGSYAISIPSQLIDPI